MRVRKLETMRNADVTGPDVAEADRIAGHHARAIIDAAFAGRKYEPAPAEKAEIEWCKAVRRRQWEVQNPGRSYEAHRADRRAKVRAEIDAAFGQGDAREEARRLADAEWEESRCATPTAAAAPEKQAAPPLPVALR